MKSTLYAWNKVFTIPTVVKQLSGSKRDGYFSTASTDDEVGGQGASGCTPRIALTSLLGAVFLMLSTGDDMTRGLEVCGDVVPYYLNRDISCY
jgi:hypothetical protein